jgi:hypothetical protein
MPVKSPKTVGRLPGGADAGASGQPIPAKPAAAQKYKTAPRSYRFQRAQSPGLIEVLNENLYVMAEYSERTGSVRWRRVVAASERDQIENWLKDHYPTV